MLWLEHLRNRNLEVQSAGADVLAAQDEHQPQTSSEGDSGFRFIHMDFDERQGHS